MRTRKGLFVFVASLLFIVSLSGSVYAAGGSPQPVFVNIFMHTVDPVNIELSHPHIRRIVQMFRDEGVNADLYFRGALVQTIENSAIDPDLSKYLSETFTKGFSLGYLENTNRPLMADLARDMDWMEAYKLVDEHLSQWKDIYTGNLAPNKLGGAALAAKLFGRPVDIGRRHHLVQETYWLRERGAIMNMGSHADDFISEFGPEPMAWYLGMPAVINYPLTSSPTGSTVAGILNFGSSEENAGPAVEKMFAGLNRDVPHFLYCGGHPVDMYADNDKWNKTGRGHVNHVEDWAWDEGKEPKSAEEARIPKEFLFTPDQIEARYRHRRAILKKFAEIAKRDPSIHIVTARELMNYIDTTNPIKLKQSEVVETAKFIREKTQRGLPEYVSLSDGRSLSLVEAYQALLNALTGSKSAGKLPESIEVDKNLIGATQIPTEWKTGGTASQVAGKTLSVSEILDMAQSASAAIKTAKPSCVPVESRGKDPNITLNAAEFMHAMAQAVEKLAAGEKEANVSLKDLTLSPDPCVGKKGKWYGDEEVATWTKAKKFHFLQLWTLKPMKFQEKKS